MKAYIICIIITMLFALIAEKFLKNNNMKIGVFFLIISILVPCFIAGVRSDTVGTDIHNYLTKLFNDFIQKDMSIIAEAQSTGIEIGFVILVFIGSLFKSLNFTFLLIELAVILPIYIYAYLNRKNFSLSFTIFIFLTTMYCYSLSMMRQSIAISIIILSTYYFINNDNKKTILLFMLALLFHQTAIIALLVYSIIYVIYRVDKNKLFYLFMIIAVTVLASLFIEQLIMFLPAKYLKYLETRFVSSVNLVSLLKIVLWLFPVGLCLGKCKRNTNDHNYLVLSVCLIMFNVVFYLLGIEIPTASRISLYFSNLSYFIFIPIIQKLFNIRSIINIMLVCLLVFYWWHMTADVDSNSGIYPYNSDMIEILN